MADKKKTAPAEHAEAPVSLTGMELGLLRHLLSESVRRAADLDAARRLVALDDKLGAAEEAIPEAERYRSPQPPPPRTNPRP